jgi:oligopeptide transport system substrate-binding protein
MTRIARPFTLLLGVLTLLAACAGPMPTATPTPVPSPTATPTPAPAAYSPIGDAPEGFATHIEPGAGYAFHHPDAWRAANEPLRASEVVLASGDGTVRLDGFALADSSTVPLAERLQQVLDSITPYLSASFTVEREGTVTLPSGIEAQRAVVRTSRDEVAWVHRVQVAQRRLITAVLEVSGPAATAAAQSGDWDTTFDSLVLFSPAPYGVARNRSLTMPWADPITLDPAMSREGRSHLYVAHLFSGLVRLDERMQPAPDLAERWSVDPTGTVYTFTLREGLSFHDGGPLRAEDVAYSLERAADPALRSPTAALYLGDIVGVAEKLAGEAQTLAGVSVVDERTIRITIDAPKAYFLAKLAYPTAAVVDRRSVERAPFSWWERAPLVGSGPFMLKEWDEGASAVLERYEAHHAPASLEFVVLAFNTGPAMAAYEADLVDVAFIGGASVDRAEDPASGMAGQLHIFPQLNTHYLGFNTLKAPFDDPQVRRAFALAVDTPRLAEVVYGSLVTPARGLLPPGIPGFDPALEGIGHDPEAARAALAASSYGGPEGLPPVVFTTAGTGTISPDLELLVAGWREALGVEVEVRQLDPPAYYYKLADEVDGLFDFGWIADYPDPENFLDLLLHSGALENNIGRYDSPAYDALVERARTEQDEAERMTLYREAERVLLADAAIVPLFHAPDYVLVRPTVDGFSVSPLGIPVLGAVSVRPQE